MPGDKIPTYVKKFAENEKIKLYNTQKNLESIPPMYHLIRENSNK